MTTITIRTVQEIQQRIRDRIDHDLLAFEVPEYFRCLSLEDSREWLKPEAVCDDWPNDDLAVIDRTAKNYLTFWLDKIENERGLSVCRAISHYIAWKWLLGHPDADTFPGSIRGGNGGYYQRTAYEYIAAQIKSGEWDRLNTEARKQATHG